MTPARQSQDQMRPIERSRPTLHRPAFAPQAAPAAPGRSPFVETVALTKETTNASRCGRTGARRGR
jgi:hypothetical protein